MAHPSDNPLRQQLQLLLGGYGFNFYGDVAKARADDLLVRQAASDHLSSAVKALSAMEQTFRRQFVPPSTRENPYPPADILSDLRAIASLRARIADVETRLRGMPVPTQDKIWWRFRDELSTLNALLSYDTLLIQEAEAVQHAAESLSAAGWRGGAAASALDPSLTAIEQTMQERRTLLAIG